MLRVPNKALNRLSRLSRRYIMVIKRVARAPRAADSVGVAMPSVMAPTAATNIPVGFISAVINQEFGMNFNEYVNHYRVEYVKELIGNPEAVDLSLKTLASQSGFISMNAFSNAFSKREGCMPMEYIRMQKRISGKKP